MHNCLWKTTADTNVPLIGFIKGFACSVGLLSTTRLEPHLTFAGLDAFSGSPKLSYYALCPSQFL